MYSKTTVIHHYTILWDTKGGNKKISLDLLVSRNEKLHLQTYLKNAKTQYPVSTNHFQSNILSGKGTQSLDDMHFTFFPLYCHFLLLHAFPWSWHKFWQRSTYLHLPKGSYFTVFFRQTNGLYFYSYGLKKDLTFTHLPGDS